MSKNTVTVPTEGDYKGSPTLTLPLGNERDFTFGVTKALAIITHLDAVKAFAAKHRKADATLDKARAALKAQGLTDEEINAALA